MSTKPWNPVQQPYRVSRTHVAGAALHGWYTSVQVFATREEAEAAHNRPLGRGEKESVLSVAANPETWTKNGRWVRLARRVRAKAKAQGRPS